MRFIYALVFALLIGNAFLFGYYITSLRRSDYVEKKIALTKRGETVAPKTSTTEGLHPLIYKSSKSFLMNGTRGNNYFIGRFKSMDKIEDSTDIIIVLSDMTSNQNYSFRIVFDTENSELKVEAPTLFGFENLSKIDSANSRNESLEFEGTSLSNESGLFLEKISSEDVVAVTFYSCLIDVSEGCNRDKLGNIYLLGLFKRIKA